MSEELALIEKVYIGMYDTNDVSFWIEVKLLHGSSLLHIGWDRLENFLKTYNVKYDPIKELKNKPISVHVENGICEYRGTIT